MFKVKKKVKIKNQDSKINSKITIFYRKWKKWSEMEKEKKELKKLNQNKSIKPKGFVARKFGVITFWTLFGFMFLVVMVNLFSSGNETNAEKKVEIEQNYATTPEAIQFAKNFIQDYFTWNIKSDEFQKHVESLEKYYTKEVYENSALDTKRAGYNSTFKDAQLKKVEKKGDNLSYITFLVTFQLTKVGTDGKENPAKITTSKYVVVPVAYDGKTFGVYELPKFTYIYEDKTTIKEVKTQAKLQKADTGIAEQIEEFLPTFFKTYAEDEKDKLNYMLTNEKVTDGLNGTMKFDSIEKVEVFNGKKEKHYIVFTQVLFADPLTKIPFRTNYQLEIVKQKDHYVVFGIDNLTEKGVVSEKSQSNENKVKDGEVEVSVPNVEVP